MTSGSVAADSQQVRLTIAKVKTLLVKSLQTILREEGLRHTGVKSVLQARIINHIEALGRDGLTDRFNRLRNLIYNPDLSPATTRFQYPPPPPHLPHLPPPPPSPINGATHPFHPSRSISTPSLSSHIACLNFKESPFYSILQALAPAESCPVMYQNRHTVKSSVKLPKVIIDRFKTESALRVMLFCAAEDPLVQYTTVDIAFPREMELKVNGESIKANFRGLKSKPGSTQPVDITDSIQKMEHFGNSITLTYALTDRKFSFIINLVKAHSVEELVERLKTGRSISKERVIQEMVSKIHDSDLVAVSTVMSLKCPVSMSRIQLPCRSTVCSHHQCFDAASFLQMQEQGPTWSCPVCLKTLSFPALVVDQYVNEILQSTAPTVEQVTIEPNGQWSDKTSTLASSSANLAKRDGGGVQGTPSSRAKGSNNGTGISSLLATPNDLSVISTTSSSARSRNKRTFGQVIDLTASDDEDQPLLQMKRPTLRSTPTLTRGNSGGGRAISRPDGPVNGVNFALPYHGPQTPLSSNLTPNVSPAQTL